MIDKNSASYEANVERIDVVISISVIMRQCHNEVNVERQKNRCDNIDFQSYFYSIPVKNLFNNY